MDKIIKKVLDKLEKNGFEAYVVGGYVRDTLLGIKTYDVDICTNALQKDIYNLFDIKKTNKYGGSNIKIKNYNIDITTFRKENNYEGRKPTEIQYINNLEEDLLRRDFTINSICMNKNGKVIDKLNGIEDLNNCLIKMIGDPIKRIEEDPLRILRTIRFATLLNFKIDENLKITIKKNVELVKQLSKTRIKDEFRKIFTSPNYKIGLLLCEELGISKALGIECDEVIFCDIIGMWAQIKIKDIPFTKEEKNNIIKITDVLKEGIINKEILFKYGLYTCTVAGQIMGYKLSDINNMYKKMPIKENKDINIDVQEILTLINRKPSEIIKLIYQNLSEEILNNNLKNNRNELKKYIINNKGKWLN